MNEPASRFLTTRWSMVAVARGTGGDAEAARRALGELCEAYWYPLYARARRAGRTDEQALDLVQAFLASLLEDGRLAGGEVEGSFRAYLLGALRNFERNEARAAGTLKRGEGAALSLDEAAVRGAAERFAAESGATTPEPDLAFERAWAQEVLRTARQRLRAEWESRGRGPVFAALEDTLDGGTGARTHAERAEELGASVGAIKVAAHRLRARLAELVRDEVAQLVEDPADVDAELAHLFTCLGGRAGGRA